MFVNVYYVHYIVNNNEINCTDNEEVERIFYLLYTALLIQWILQCIKYNAKQETTLAIWNTTRESYPMRVLN